MRQKSGSKTRLSRPEITRDRIGLINKGSLVIRTLKQFYLLISQKCCTTQSYCKQRRIGSSNAQDERSPKREGSPRSRHGPMQPEQEQTRRASSVILGSTDPRAARGVRRAHRIAAAHATRQRQRLPSCCTCASAMLAKPRFYEPGNTHTDRKSKSRLNSKGLDR